MITKQKEVPKLLQFYVDPCLFCHNWKFSNGHQVLKLLYFQGNTPLLLPHPSHLNSRSDIPELWQDNIDDCTYISRTEYKKCVLVRYSPHYIHTKHRTTQLLNRQTRRSIMPRCNHTPQWVRALFLFCVIHPPAMVYQAK